MQFTLTFKTQPSILTIRENESLKSCTSSCFLEGCIHGKEVLRHKEDQFLVDIPTYLLVLLISVQHDPI